MDENNNNEMTDKKIDDNFKTQDDYFTLFKNTDAEIREGELKMDEYKNLENSQNPQESIHRPEPPTPPRYIEATGEPPHMFVSENIKSQKPKKNLFKTLLLGVCILTTIGVFAFGGIKGAKYLIVKFNEVVTANSSQDDSLEQEGNKQQDEVNEGNIPANAAEKQGNIQAYDVSDVVSEVSKSVVSINIEATHETIFNQAFTSTGAGSGIIFSEDAENIYVATNNHVIQGATNVTISLDDEIQVPATSVGADAKSDLAVISVSKVDMQTAGLNNYEIAKIGNSDALEVGDTAIAIGNALGEGKSATLGIVSAKDKKINVDGKELNVIQTDAAINAGNSGGALVNGKGEVIGINTAKLAVAGVEGMGYSIPVNDAKIIINEIMTTGTVARPYLGVVGKEISQEMADMYGIPAAGFYVTEVVPGSGAAEAGVVAGDVIVGYGEEKIDSDGELTDLISKTPVGETVKLYILRDTNTPVVLDVVIKNMNPAAQF